MLGGSRRPNIADSFSITTCCALRCLPASHKLTSATLVVAELNLKPNVSVVRQIAGHTESDHMKILPATGAAAVDAALALSATLPAAGLAIQELMRMEGQEIHTVNPEILMEVRAATASPAHPFPPPGVGSRSAQRTYGPIGRPRPPLPPTYPILPRQEDVMTLKSFACHFPGAVVVGILRRKSWRSDAEQLKKRHSHAHLTVHLAHQLDLDEAAVSQGTAAGEGGSSTDVEVLLAPSQDEEVRRVGYIPYTPLSPLHSLTLPYISVYSSRCVAVMSSS